MLPVGALPRRALGARLARGNGMFLIADGEGTGAGAGAPISVSLTKNSISNLLRKGESMGGVGASWSIPP